MFGSLRKKIGAGLIGISLICIIYTMVLMGFQFGKMFSTQVQNDALSLAMQIENGIQYHEADTAENIQKYIDHSKEDIKSMSYLSIVDNNNKIIASTSKSDVGKTAVEEVLSVINSGEVIHHDELNAETKEPVHEVIIPFVDEANNKGALLLQVSLSEVKDLPITILKKVSLFIIAIVILAVIVSYVVSEKLSKPIKDMMLKLKKVSEGDLSLQFKSTAKDEMSILADSMNYTMGMLREMIAGIQQTSVELEGLSEGLATSSGSVAASSEEISASVTEVSKGASRQSDSIHETVNLLDQFSYNLVKANNQLETVSESSSKIKIAASNGTVKIEELNRAVEQVEKTFLYVTDKVKMLNDNVNKINTVTDVITSVAEQTNLLALNASIEAARAGEAGKGFSVVADEIRKLAEQVLDSSKTINTIVNNVTSNTVELSKTSQVASDVILGQGKIVDNTVDSLREILGETEKIVPQIMSVYKALDTTVKSKDEIITNIQNFASDSEEISASVEVITSSVEEETVAAEELSRTANKLTDMSKSLLNSVEKFKV